MVGTELRRQLADRGDTVVSLVRRPAESAGESSWAPERGEIDPAVLEGVDAVVNLAGASLSRLPWTRAYRSLILDSRIDTTRTLVNAFSAAATPPPVLINASAIGIYGDRGDEPLDESSPGGTGFLADVVRQWEAAARAAPAPTRVVCVRTGLVLGPGGAMARLLPIVRAGIAGPLGSGRQRWSWISLYDEAAAIRHLIDTPVEGPVDLVAPEPARASEVIRELARQSHRPYWLPVPAPAISLVLGEAGRELLLASQDVSSRKLRESGFDFRDATLQRAIAALLQS